MRGQGPEKKDRGASSPELAGVRKFRLGGFEEGVLGEEGCVIRGAFQAVSREAVALENLSINDEPGAYPTRSRDANGDYENVTDQGHTVARGGKRTLLSTCQHSILIACRKWFP